MKMFTLRKCLHLEKSCYMYFNNTRKIENDEKLNNLVLEISNTSLPQVEHTKFLGVIIDNKLTWQHHLSSLVKKLSCCTGRLNHTLFESYLSYGVSVWGGAKPSKLKPVFKAQKKAIRVLFGDREKYIEKFKTCVRARPFSEQKLTSAFSLMNTPNHCSINIK